MTFGAWLVMLGLLVWVASDDMMEALDATV